MGPSLRRWCGGNAGRATSFTACRGDSCLDRPDETKLEDKVGLAPLPNLKSWGTGARDAESDERQPVDTGLVVKLLFIIIDDD